MSVDSFSSTLIKGRQVYVRDRRSMIDSPSGAGQTKHQSLLAQFHFLWSLAHLAEGLSRPAGTLCTLQRKSSYFIESPLRTAKKTFVPCWSPFAPCRKPLNTLPKTFARFAESFYALLLSFSEGGVCLCGQLDLIKDLWSRHLFYIKLRYGLIFYSSLQEVKLVFFCSCNWLECNELQTVFDIFVTTWLSDNNNAASSLK